MDALKSAALALVVGWLAIRLLVWPRFHGLAADHPNERSLHSKVVPRTGGIAVVLGASAGIALHPSTREALFWLVGCVLAAISFLDDRRGLPVGVRLVAQIAAAIAALLITGWDQPIWYLVFALLTIVWMTNLYNFMDGSDGLAGGMAVSGFGAYALAAGMSGHVTLAAACAALVAGCVAFLTQNFPPARIFLGDVGSTVLGFSAAAFGFFGVHLEAWPLWFPGLVFLPFIADASITLIRRALRRERIWEAHREHYYQRLILSGWSHARMANTAYALMLLMSATGLLTLRMAPRFGWPVLLAWFALVGLLMRIVDARWSRHVSARASLL